MDHKITIEIIIKNDFLKPEEQTIPKFNSLQINPEIIKSLLPKFLESLMKESPEEKPKEEVKKEEKVKPKKKKGVKK